jgi:hypothetical protein
VGVANPIGLGGWVEVVMGFRTDTADEGSRAWCNPLRNSRIRGSEVQGRRALVHCVGLRAGYLSSASMGLRSRSDRQVPCAVGVR